MHAQSIVCCPTADDPQRVGNHRHRAKAKACLRQAASAQGHGEVGGTQQAGMCCSEIHCKKFGAGMRFDDRASAGEIINSEPKAHCHNQLLAVHPKVDRHSPDDGNRPWADGRTEPTDWCRRISVQCDFAVVGHEVSYMGQQCRYVAAMRGEELVPPVAQRSQRIDQHLSAV